MGPIHIVTAANNRYARPLGVMIHSLLSNTARRSDIVIYILESGLSKKNKRKIDHVAAQGNAKTKFLSVDKSLFKGLKESDYITKETYYRLAIPQLLSKKIVKVLYLDSDLIVKEDINQLWSINIDRYHLAAVEKGNLSSRRKRALGIPKDSRYFNAGVLLINLNRWRKDQVSKKILDYSKKNKSKIQFCSQDPMNAILQDKWLNLDLKWNFITAHANQYKHITPAIIHYTGNKKPWDNTHILKHEYIHYSKTLDWPKD